MSRKEFYKTSLWRNQARYIWLKQNCICADCGRPVYVDGITTYLPRDKRLIGVVHHIKPIDESNYMDFNISLNEDNLIGICQDCHASRHGSDVTKNDVMFDESGNLIQRQTIKRM